MNEAVGLPADLGSFDPTPDYSLGPDYGLLPEAENCRGSLCDFSGNPSGAEIVSLGLLGPALKAGGRALAIAKTAATTGKVTIGGARTAAVLERVVTSRIGARLFGSQGGLLNTGRFRVGVSTKFGQPQFRIAVGGGREPWLKIDLGSALSKFY